MNFKNWLLLNENIETNFNKWLETLFQYTKKNTVAEKVLMNIPGVPARSGFIETDPKTWGAGGREQLGYIIDTPQEIIIKTVLKEKNLENFNWFSFSLGYYSAKPGFFKEDLEIAIDVTKRRIDNRELPKTEIGTKGWLVIGYEAKDKVQEYLQTQQQISNRQLSKMKKSGATLNEDPNLIQLVAQEDNIKIYHLPALKSVDNIKERHLILCKYGKGTDWCTAQPSWDAHQGYAKNNIYIIHVDDKPKYQFVGCQDGNNIQFMNVSDVYIRKLEGNIYDLLTTHLAEEFKCYGMKRIVSLKDLLISDSKSKEVIYNNLSHEDFFELVRGANPEQKKEIVKDVKNYLKFTDFFTNAREILYTKKILRLEDLVNYLSKESFKPGEDSGLPEIKLSSVQIENVLKENMSEIVWRYYSYNYMNTQHGRVKEKNDLLTIFGKENVEKEYPALKIIKPENYFKNAYLPDKTGKKPSVGDTSEHQAPSIERILSGYQLHDVFGNNKKLSTIEAIEKVGVENLNFENKRYMRNIVFMSKNFEEILNYFKSKNLSEKIEEIVLNMKEDNIKSILDNYLESEETYNIKSLEDFRKQNLYKILKYLHETAIKQGNLSGLGSLMDRRGTAGILSDYYAVINENSTGIFEQAIFEIVGEKNFIIGSWVIYFKIIKSLIFNNQTESKLFKYLKNKELSDKDKKAAAVPGEHFNWLINMDEKAESLHTLNLLGFLIEKMPENDNLTYLFLHYGNLNKEFIDKHEEFTKRILEKYGKYIGTVDENGIFKYDPVTKHSMINIDQENLKYAWNKYLGINIKSFKDKQEKQPLEFDPSIL